MDSRGKPAPSPGDSSSGLESHLRNLILTNATPEVQPPSGSRTSHAAGRPIGSEAAEANDPHKSSKKRPNQAQRRQMGAQFSIPVDPRPLAAAETQRHGRGSPGPGQRWRGPRQMDSPSQSNARLAPDDSTLPEPHGHGARHHAPQSQYGRTYSPNNNRRQPFDSTGRSSPSGGWRQGYSQSPHQPRKLVFRPEEISNQSTYLNQLSYQIVSASEIDRSEIMEKESFRMRIEQIIQEVITNHEQELAQRWDFPSRSVELKCFGSLASGFATMASDMDLALLSPLSQIQPDSKGSPIPRLIEKALLNTGIGARLLTRTRVPIIKLCEQPPELLYQQLVAYREQWENGSAQDVHDAHEEDEGGARPSSANQVPENDDGPEEAHKDHAESEDLNEFDVPSLDGREPQRLYLRQGAKTSLAGYITLSKRVLRKAGGRDIRNPTVPTTLTNHEWVVLNCVSRAFILGLADPELRQRLQQYASLQFNPGNGTDDRHSLQAVTHQIEGEHFLLLLERMLVDARVDLVDAQTDQVIRMWESIQASTDYGSNPALYAKELQNALDRLRKIPHGRLAELEQGPEETVSSYAGRTFRILEELQKRSPHIARGLEKIAIKQYISGILVQEIRQSVSADYEAAAGVWSLFSVARRHIGLDLAREFSRALDKKVYDPEHTADIKEYIKLLRVPLRQTTKGHASFDFVSPISPKTATLVSRIRELPDPHTLVSSHPKEKYRDQLEFPKTGCGVQCDINFSALLALQNTILLRCYSHTDPRVRPMVLFVKHWAKMRGINSGYRGTLSSYGYVLMVLHYLVNVVQPFVCPNLQQLVPPPPPGLSPEEIEKNTTLNGYRVQFWRNEDEIIHLASTNQLTRSTESIGGLLRGFFEYYAQNNFMSSGNGKGFDWGRDVLSIRTPGGLLSKQEKGWTGAKTVYEPQGDSQNTDLKAAPPAADAEAQAKARSKSGDVKEVRLRYLFAIEDPFELDHNVARTVTHNGIVSIRDEFRRAWRIIKAAGSGSVAEDLLLDTSTEKEQQQQQPDTLAPSLPYLLHEIHGSAVFEDDDE